MFVDDRSPGDVGWMPLTSTLTLLGNVNWVSLTVRNVYELDGSDPGTIDATLNVRTTGSGPWGASAELRHVVDLAVLPDRITLQPLDESATYLSLSGGLTGIATITARSAYRYNPPPPEPGRAPDRFDDLELTLTLGTLTQNDMRPGLAITYARDLNEGYTSAFGVEATARIDTLRLSALERLDLPSGRISSSRLRAELPGYVAVQADGLAWLPPEWIGLPSHTGFARQIGVSVEAAPQSGQPTWQLRFSTTYDPDILSGAGGYRASTLTGRAIVADYQVGSTRFSIDGFAELQWRDALRRRPTCAAPTWCSVCSSRTPSVWQGTLGYAAAYSTSLQGGDQRAPVARAGGAGGEAHRLALRRRGVQRGLGPHRQRPYEARFQRQADPDSGLEPLLLGALRLLEHRNRSSGDNLDHPGADQGLSQVFETGWSIPRRTP